MNREEINNELGIEYMLSIASYVGFSEGAKEISVDGEEANLELIYSVAEDLCRKLKSDEMIDSWGIIEESVNNHARPYEKPGPFVRH